MNEKILRYFKEGVAKGNSLESLKRALVDAGWDPREINEVAERFQDKKGQNISRGRKKTSGMAVASFVLSLCWICFAWIPLLGVGILILAIIFGFISLSKMKHNPELKGKAFAIIGIVLGFVLLIASVILVLLTFSSGVAVTKLESSSEIIKSNTACMDLDFKVKSLTKVGETNYEITFHRTATGEVIEELGLVFFDGDLKTDEIDFGFSLSPLETKSSVIDVGLFNVDKVYATPVVEGGHICDITTFDI